METLRLFRVADLGLRVAAHSMRTCAATPSMCQWIHYWYDRGGWGVCDTALESPDHGASDGATPADNRCPPSSSYQNPEILR